MNREIKFRVYAEDSKRFYYLNDIWNMPDPCYTGEIQQYTGLLDKNGKEIYEGDIVSLDGNMTADDSLGVLPNGWTFDEKSVYQVVWNNELALWELDFTNENWNDVIVEFRGLAEAYKQKYKSHARSLLTDEKVEIIGNIYQDSNLLNNINHENT